MASPAAQQAGAVSGQSRYAGVGMPARQFTGLWTQASPYSDAAVPYLVGKFYGGSRYDRIIDGLDREISQRLTDVRSPGSIVYNSETFPAIDSFYDWKLLRNNVETIRVMADGGDGTLYDATAGQKSSIFTKSAGAGPNRMLGLANAQFYAGNGVDQKKWLFPGGWQASKAVDPGTLINQGAEPGTLFLALGGMLLPIVATAVSGSGSSWQHLVYVDTTQVPNKFANLVGAEVTFSGLTMDTTLNGQTLPVDAILSSTLGILQVTTAAGTLQDYTPDTGSGTTGNGTTGASTPSFNGTQFAVTADGGQQWKCYGTAVEDTGLAVPAVAPTLTPVSGRFWQPNMDFPLYTSLLDSNGNIEVVAVIGGTTRSGPVYPKWATAPALAATVASTLTGVPSATGNFFGTVYQNLSANTELHSGYGTVVTGGLIAYYELLVGPTNPPTQNTWATTFTSTDRAGTGSNGKLGFNFSVPPGWYYALQSFGDVSGSPGAWDAAAQVPVATGVSTPGGANAVTVDGGLTWYNLGAPGAWQPDAANAGVTGSCLLDSNGNLQWLYSGAGGTSGGSEPTWGTALGNTVTDGGLTWLCISAGGSGAALSYQALQYAYSLHGVDGSVSTASPVATIYGGVLGTPAGVQNPTLTLAATSAGMFADTQIDQIWIWRTVQGGATLILEDQIPADGLTSSFSYGEAGVADNSTLGLGSLNPFIPAPVASANNPPTPTSLPMCYAYQRVWWADGNLVRFSGGPDTLAGNGNTTQPPLNFLPFLGTVYDIVPITVQNGGLVVFTSSGIQIILGTGTSTNPFYPTSYYALVSVSGYNSVCVYGTTMYVMEANKKVSAIAIQYPFNPNTGYTEVGFPIGDQFKKVTTGGISESLYSSSTAFLSWNNQSTNESALYVADGAVGWFRMAMVSQPESGVMWSPRRAIAGGTSAVQALETAPGEMQLLIGPAVSGPILTRDDTGTVWDDDGTAYPAWDVKGVILLCSTGDSAEIAHISSKSRRVGARPVLSVLLNEVEALPERPWQVLDNPTNDPANNEESLSVFSDRYVLLDNAGFNSTGDCMMVRFDYGTQAAGDELLDWQFFEAVTNDREEQVAKT